MFFNSSSNASLISCFSNPNAYPFVFLCSENLLSSAIFASFTVTNLLFLLPIYILIFWIGFRRSWCQRSVSSGITSHSDAITYNMVTLEILAVLGVTLFCIGMFSCSVGTMTAGYYMITLTYPGLSFLHCMTCIEHYLAVVHPVTYLGSKQAGGIRIRNIAIGLVWIVCFGEVVMTVLTFPDFPIFVVLAIVTLCLSVVSFCCISTLRVLIGLGKVGGDRERIDQSKQRAFFTICAILPTLMMRFTGLLVGNFMLDGGTETHKCSLLMSGFWLCLPSSLILPLLFLHRAGTLACLSRNRNQQ